jgi:hypothetical protein
MAGLKTALLCLWAPVRGLAEAAEKGRFLWPLLLVMAVAVGFNALAVTRIDYASPASDALDKEPDAAKMTPHEREEKIAQAVKLGTVGTLATGVAWPPLSALLGALFLWLGFKVAGGKPGFGATFAVAANCLVPDAVKMLCTLPALLTRAGALSAIEVAQLLPSNLAVLAPEGMSVGRLALLASVDLFALWSVAMIAAGMAGVGKVSYLRSAIVVVVLWASFVLVFRFAVPSLTLALS